jgi:mRNA interferase MazF
LAALPQADGQKKLCPVLLLRQMPQYGNFLVCGISTQIRQYVPNFDELIQANDPDFGASGLIKPSVVRLNFLAIVCPAEIIGQMGRLSSDRHQRLLSNLANYLKA